MACDTPTEADFGLCGPCWREISFISGLVCDNCGLPLPGEGDGNTIYCDSCMIAPKPWSKGRAAVLYDGGARKLVLGLKHGDRLDLVTMLAGWMARAGREIVTPDTVMVPVPLRWRRLLWRKYNQSALLARKVADNLDCSLDIDLLERHKSTRLQDGMTREERTKNLQNAIRVRQRKIARVAGAKILLIDDVMTSGATLAACSEAAFQAGAAEVNVLTLARVARHP